MFGNRFILAAAAAAAALTGASAHAQAGYVTATYSGTIDTVYDGSTYALGEPISYSVTFDPAKLKDVTASVDAVLATFPPPISFASVLAASLSDDPDAALTIEIGGTVYSKFDQIHYGTPTSDTDVDLGSGNFPIVEYLDGAFAGIGGAFHIHGSSEALFTDPIGAARGAFDGHGFYIGDATSDAEGDFDISKAVFVASAAPEPSTWALLTCGVGLLGLTLRRRPRETPRAA